MAHVLWSWVTSPDAKEPRVIRLVLTDLDNTLIPLGADACSERAIEAIHACLDAGVAFGPVTGRNHLEAHAFLRGDDASVATGVYVNGQHVRYEGRLVSETYLDRDGIDRIEDLLADRPGCAVITFRDDGVADFTGDVPENLAGMCEKGMRLGWERHEHLPRYEVVKAGIICNVSIDEERALKARLEALCPTFDFHNTTHRWFDVVPRGWSKAQGVEILRGRMGIEPDEICVFGDAENDLPLFDVCVHSCAVANATDAVRERARWHVGASADDGVAIALEDIARTASKGTLPSFFS